MRTLIEHITVASQPPYPDWEYYHNAVRSAAKHCTKEHHALEVFMELGMNKDVVQMCLEAACKAGSVRAVEMLLDAGGEPMEEWIPMAAREGRFEVVVLIERGGFVDAVADGCTALVEVLHLWDNVGFDGWPGWRQEACEEEGEWAGLGQVGPERMWKEGGLGKEWYGELAGNLGDEREDIWNTEQPIEWDDERHGMTERCAVAEARRWCDDGFWTARWLLTRGAHPGLTLRLGERAVHTQDIAHSLKRVMDSVCSGRIS